MRQISNETCGRSESLWNTKNGTHNFHGPLNTFIHFAWDEKVEYQVTWLAKSGSVVTDRQLSRFSGPSYNIKVGAHTKWCRCLRFSQSFVPVTLPDVLLLDRKCLPHPHPLPLWPVSPAAKSIQGGKSLRPRLRTYLFKKVSGQTQTKRTVSTCSLSPRWTLMTLNCVNRDVVVVRQLSGASNVRSRILSFVRVTTHGSVNRATYPWAMTERNWY